MKANPLLAAAVVMSISSLAQARVFVGAHVSPGFCACHRGPYFRGRAFGGYGVGWRRPWYPHYRAWGPAWGVRAYVGGAYWAAPPPPPVYVRAVPPPPVYREAPPPPVTYREPAPAPAVQCPPPPPPVQCPPVMEPAPAAHKACVRKRHVIHHAKKSPPPCTSVPS